VKIGLLSDIHANLAALDAVLRAADAAGVERLFCCGDFVGYYYQPEAVLNRLDAWSWVGVRGNHEDMLALWLSGERHAEITSRYGSGIRAASGMPASRLDALAGLPVHREVEIEGRRALLCHGTPWDTDEYVYPDTDPAIRDRMAAGGQDIVVFGHTHYPVHWQIAGCHVVNPGSVGQPRDRKPGACWAIWDTTSMTVELRREVYDCTALVADCQQRDPQLPYLADVLTRVA